MKIDNSVVSTPTISSTPRSKTKLSSTNARRKSVLPLDSKVYQEIANYARSSSPRPSDDEDEMKE